MNEITQPYVWYALGLSLIACLLYAADVYMRREWQGDCDRLLVGAELDTLDLDAAVPPCECDECLADDGRMLVEETEAWLRARGVYERERRS